MHYVTNSVSTVAVDHHINDFGITDSKGRAIGCAITVWSHVVTFGPVQHSPTKTETEPGVWAMVCVWKTRNGERFGRWPCCGFFKTPDEVKAYADRRIAEIIKRSK